MPDIARTFTRGDPGRGVCARHGAPHASHSPSASRSLVAISASAGIAFESPAVSDRFDAFDDDEQEVTGVIATLGSLVRGPAVVVATTTPLSEVRRTIVERRVPAIAVADGDQLRGIVTRTDVLRVADADATAGDAMSGVVFALHAASSIEKAAALMAWEGVGQIVVIGPDGELLGMVSSLDIARHVAIASGLLVE